jgi:hypothetical protein
VKLSRWLAALVTTLSLLIPAYAHASPAHGGRGEAVVLRFHFVTGQGILYRVTVASHMTVTDKNGAPLSAAFRSSHVHVSGFDTTFLLNVHVIRVDASGVATIVESISGNRAVKPRQSTITIAPDGGQRYVGRRPPISAPPLAIYLPPRPVRLGDQWSLATVFLPKRASNGPAISERGKVSLRLVGFGLAAGEPVAIIQGTESSALQAVVVSTEPGGVARDEEDVFGRWTERAVFGLSSGTLVSRQMESVTVLLDRSKQPGVPLYTHIIRTTAPTLIQRITP